MMRNRSLVMICVLALLTVSSRGTGAASGLDDATILAIFDQANTADIVTGRLGAKYAVSEEVRALISTRPICNTKWPFISPSSMLSRARSCRRSRTLS